MGPLHGGATRATTTSTTVTKKESAVATDATDVMEVMATTRILPAGVEKTRNPDHPVEDHLGNTLTILTGAMPPSPPVVSQIADGERSAPIVGKGCICYNAQFRADNSKR